MPAYGKNLSPAETTALVAFLKTLRPTGQAPAHDASLVSVETETQPGSKASGTKLWQKGVLSE